MKKLIFSIVSILVTLCASAQVNLVKVADYFDDFEITNFSTYYDTIYNNGNDVTMSVNVRFKLKKPFGTTNLIPNGSRIAIYYEPVNGNNIRTTINEIIIDGQWQPPIGGIYSPYMQVNVTIPKEYLLSGNLRTYFISPNDPVANYWGYGISVAAKSSRKLTVVNVANFIGPSQVCSEATYTIERPDAITLENATGIATLTALGNNQWKITRTGTANGVVKLRSTSNGKTFDKEIIIGMPNPNIVGPSNITAPTAGKTQDYSFNITPIAGATYQWSFEGSSNVSFPSSTTDSSVIIWVKSHTGTAPYFCKLRLKVTTECGTSDFIDYNVKITPAQGGLTPPDL